MNLIHFKTIDSTNAEALRRLASSQNVRALDQTVIAADGQTAGRGRLKRAFYSPAQKGIYFTAIYAPENPIDDPARLTACAAVAVCRSLKEFFNVEAKIKWVNDVYVNGKKVCGILAEGHLGAAGVIDAAAIGIGINIYPSDFPADIAARAGAVLQAQDCGRADSFGLSNNLGASNNCSQAQEAGGDIRLDLARDVCQKLFDILDDGARTQAALQEYADLSFIIGKQITVIPVIGDERTAYPATVLGIDKNARLLVRLDDKSERALSCGEISIKI
ncbi:MAG: biotin--[acetyl-CoA-carboxylase] ligase [Treponema sp.]|nr:biotin--[acetyl-CoA-carboxylase] ligase [Treponema sp.]